MKKRIVKLADVAKAAKVSQGTASNVFNRPELVRPEVRERVEASARRLAYSGPDPKRSEEHTSELQSQSNLVCRLLLEKKKEIYQSLHQLRRKPPARPLSALWRSRRNHPLLDAGRDLRSSSLRPRPRIRPRRGAA